HPETQVRHVSPAQRLRPITASPLRDCPRLHRRSRHALGWGGSSFSRLSKLTEATGPLPRTSACIERLGFPNQRQEFRIDQRRLLNPQGMQLYGTAYDSSMLASAMLWR